MLTHSKIIDSFQEIESALKNAFETDPVSGQKAIDIIKKTLPDVIFLDFVMPVKNGVEVAKEAKLLWPEIKIIGMSTIDDERIIADAKKHGVDEFIEKPFTKDSIIEALAKVGFEIDRNQQKTSNG